MAMTKKDKLQFSLLEQELLQANIKASLHWSPKYGPDVAPPDSSTSTGSLSGGYYYNAHGKTVSPACSSSIGHGIGSIEKTSSQRPIHLYSTKLKALVDMRHEIAMKAAKELHKIDCMIATEQELPTEQS